MVIPVVLGVLLGVTVAVVATAGGGGPDTATPPLDATTSTTATTSTITTTSTTPESTAPPGGVANVHVRDLAYVPGQTTWTHVSNGITITVRVATPPAKAGDPVQFDVVLSSTDGPCCALMFLPGDQPLSEQRYSCTPGEPTASGPVTLRQTHAYATAGRFRFTFVGVRGTCAAPVATAGFAGVIDAT